MTFVIDKFEKISVKKCEYWCKLEEDIEKSLSRNGICYGNHAGKTDGQAESRSH